MTEEKKYPKVTVGALIFNKNGKILLGKGLKWKGKYTIPGGHVNYGEKISDTLKREIAEETNIKVKDIKILDPIFIGESVFSNDFHEKNHLIFSNFICEYQGGDEKVEQKEEFDGDFEWFIPEEALKLDLAIDIDKLIKKYIEYRDSKQHLEGWKRCQADLENYKKDQSRRIEEFRNFTKSDNVAQILPVLDNFHASTDHIPEDQKKSPWVEGIMHIQKQLENVLKDNGVEEIETKAGDEFNPEIHEAIQQETNGKKQEANNKINKIVKKGYRMGDKVIRAAKVIVG